jgi:L-rhamnose mutarotase
MNRVALHTVLREGAEAEYDRVHATIPDDLRAALVDAGVRQWRIWRDGRHLFHLVDVDDYHRMRHTLRDHPANVPWQARMSQLLEVEDDYSGTDNGLDLVWELAP